MSPRRSPRSGPFRTVASALAPLAFVALATLAAGCPEGRTGVTDDPICTAGNFVRCYCGDGTIAQKQCNDEGSDFGQCSVAVNVPCPDGERPGPDTGKPVVDGGVVDTPDTGPAPDSCADAIPVKVNGGTIELEGDTSKGVSQLNGAQGACGGADRSPEIVYELTPSATGRLTISVEGFDAFDPTVYLRSACDDAASQTACAETTGPGAKETLSGRGVKVGERSYLVVDGSGGTKGSYKLSMNLVPGGFCGDGDILSGEACDDGNKVEGDGCGNGCRTIDGNPPSGATCAQGHPVHLWGGAAVTGTGATNAPGYQNAIARVDNTCSVAAAPGRPLGQEHVYKVTAHKAGTVTVRVTPKTATTFNPMIYVLDTCAPDAATLGGRCVNNAGEGGVETLTFAAAAEKTYYVVVDGAGPIPASAVGEYTVSFQLP